MMFSFTQAISEEVVAVVATDEKQAHNTAQESSPN
jgi:hypothetical protein